MQPHEDEQQPTATAASAISRSVSLAGSNTNNRRSTSPFSPAVDKEQVTLLARRPTVFVRLRNFPTAASFLPAASGSSRSSVLLSNVKHRVESGKSKFQRSQTSGGSGSGSGVKKTSCVEIEQDGKTVRVLSQTKCNYSHVAQQRHSFEFDGAFSALDNEDHMPDADDKMIFDVSVKPVIKLLVERQVPGLCIAYGATASGKSALLFGGRANDPLSIGLIALSAQQLLRHYDSLFVSTVEVYLDKYSDLLTGKEVHANVTPDGLRWSSSLSRFGPIRCVEDLMPFLTACMRQRKVSKTERNDRSSRSSAIIHLLPVLGYERVVVPSSTATDATDAAATGNKKENDDNVEDDDSKNNTTKLIPMVAEKVRLSIVDLAGSERASTTTSAAGGNTVLQHREAASINLSLSNLGRTIQTLAEMRVIQHQQHIQQQQQQQNGKDPQQQQPPLTYNDSSVDAMCRSSALTWALRDELQLRGAVSFVIAISPALEHATETLSSLRFAAMLRAVRQVITIKPVIASDLKPATAESLHFLRSRTNPTVSVSSPSTTAKTGSNKTEATAPSPQPKKTTTAMTAAKRKSNLQQQQKAPAPTLVNSATQFSPQRNDEEETEEEHAARLRREADSTKNSVSPTGGAQRSIGDDDNKENSSNNTLYGDFMNEIDKVEGEQQQQQEEDDEDEVNDFGVKAMPVRSDVELYAPFFAPSPSRSRSSGASTTASPFSGDATTTEPPTKSQQQLQEMLAVCALNQDSISKNVDASSLLPHPTADEEMSNNTNKNISLTINSSFSPLLNITDCDVFVVGTCSVVREYLAFLNMSSGNDNNNRAPPLSVFCTLLPEKDFAYSSTASLETTSEEEKKKKINSINDDDERRISTTSCFILSRSRAASSSSSSSSLSENKPLSWWGQFWNRKDALDDAPPTSTTSSSAPTFDRLLCRITRAIQPHHVEPVTVSDAEGVAVEIRSGDSIDLGSSSSSSSSFFMQMRAVLMCSGSSVPAPPLPPQQQQQQQQERAASATSNNNNNSKSVFPLHDAFSDIEVVESGPTSVVAASIAAAPSSSSPTPKRQIRAGSSSSSASQQQQQQQCASPPKILFPDFPPLVPRTGSSHGSNRSVSNPTTEPSPTRPGKEVRPGTTAAAAAGGGATSSSSSASSAMSSFGSGALNLAASFNKSHHLLVRSASASATPAESSSSVMLLGGRKKKNSSSNSLLLPHRASSATLAMSDSTPESLVASSTNSMTVTPAMSAAGSKAPSLSANNNNNSNTNDEEPSPRNPCSNNNNNNISSSSSSSIPAAEFLQTASVSKSASWQEEMRNARGRQWFSHTTTKRSSKSKSSAASSLGRKSGAAAASSSSSSAQSERAIAFSADEEHNEKKQQQQQQQQQQEKSPEPTLSREDSQIILHPEHNTTAAAAAAPAHSSSASHHRPTVFKSPLAAINMFQNAQKKREDDSLLKRISVGSFIRKVMRNVAPTTQALATSQSLKQTVGIPILERKDSLRLKTGGGVAAAGVEGSKKKAEAPSSSLSHLPTGGAAVAAALAADVNIVATALFTSRKTRTSTPQPSPQPQRPQQPQPQQKSKFDRTTTATSSRIGKMATAGTRKKK